MDHADLPIVLIVHRGMSGVVGKYLRDAFLLAGGVIGARFNHAVARGARLLMLGPNQQMIFVCVHVVLPYAVVKVKSAIKRIPCREKTSLSVFPVVYCVWNGIP